MTCPFARSFFPPVRNTVQQRILPFELLTSTVFALIAALRRDPLPVRRVLDIGCGDGALLQEIRNRVRADVIGVDLRATSRAPAAVPIVQANAVLAPLPDSDVAVAVCVVHHLTDP